MFGNWCGILIWRYAHVLFLVLEWKTLTFGERTCASTNDSRTHTTCMPGMPGVTWLSPFATVCVRADRSCTAEYVAWSNMFAHAWGAGDCYNRSAILLRKQRHAFDMHFLMQPKTLMRTGAVWAPATVLWPSAFYRPWLGVASTPLFALWNHFIKNMSLKRAAMKMHNT